MNNTIKDRTIEFVKTKGITMKSFEQKCGLSTGYVTSMRKGFGSDKLNNVLIAFPELNRDWLLYGEGEMLKGSVSQTSHGDHSPNINGNGNHVGAKSDASLLEVISSLSRTIESQQRIIEQLTIGNKNSKSEK